MSVGARRGVTLIELIMTIAVGGVLVGGIVLFCSQQAVQVSGIRDRQTAADLARLKMEESLGINGTATAPLPNGRTTWTVPSFPGFTIRRDVSRIYRSGAEYINEISIAVDRAGGDFSAPLATLLGYRYSPRP